jgi:cell division protein FtsB|tara:strand:+ start:107 stop:376 length:270 start_codon:yes stop_codon:yes gene_type:complete
MDKIINLKNLFICIILAIMFLFMKDDGIIDYRLLLNNKNRLLSEIQEKSNELYDLKQENILLEKDNQHIEKIAREKYFFLFPNETIINF